MDMRHIRGLTTGEFLVEVAEGMKRNGMTYVAIFGVCAAILDAYYGDYHVVLAILIIIFGAFDVEMIRSLMR